MEAECEGGSVGRGSGLWGENVKRIESVWGECTKVEN